MRYRVTWEQRALDELDKLDSRIRNLTLEKIDRFSLHFAEMKPETLKGKFKGYYKLVVAKDYRVVYSIERRSKTIVIESVGHRSSIYK